MQNLSGSLRKGESLVQRPEHTEEQRWTFAERVGFRFIFVFLLLAVLVVFSPLGLFPIVGGPISNYVDEIAAHSAQYIGQHAFHLSGVAAQEHPTDSRDTALNWITLGMTFVVSAAGALVWSVLHGRRSQYQTAAVWLRFLLRMALVFLMLRYGLSKVFPLQMSRPSLAVLNEPLGQSSPMTLLWTLIGLHPAYQIFLGAFETIAAILLFLRRTALLGALLNAFIMANVLLYNIFFDVPVKLGAGLILLVTLAVIAPDFKPLYEFFWLNKSTAPTGMWIPMTSRRSVKVGTRVLEASIVLLALYYLVPGGYALARQERKNLLNPSKMSGEWRVASDVLIVSGRPIDMPVLTAEGSPLVAIYFEPDGRAMARSSDGRLWRSSVKIDPKNKTLRLFSPWFDGTRFQGTYSYSQVDSDHLVLRPLGDQAKTYGTLSLVRVRLPEHYPLLERGFHWVNEWALER